MTSTAFAKLMHFKRDLKKVIT